MENDYEKDQVLFFFYSFPHTCSLPIGNPLPICLHFSLPYTRFYIIVILIFCINIDVTCLSRFNYVENEQRLDGMTNGPDFILIKVPNHNFAYVDESFINDFLHSIPIEQEHFS